MQIKSDKCFLCGTTENLTRDHIPPKNLFKPPLPTNLITIAACLNCNNSYSLDEEYFRVCVATQGYGNDTGKWIWDEKVIHSTLRRSPLLRKQLIKHTFSLPVYSTSNLYMEQQRAILYDCNRINHVVEKITKGLITVYQPTVNLQEIQFDVSLIGMDMELVSFLKQMPGKSIANDAFVFWRGFNENDPRESVWFMLFYKQTFFNIATKPIEQNAG
jgi:hypothetical protein